LCIPVGDDDDIGDDIGDELVYIRSYTLVSSECIDNTQTNIHVHTRVQTNKQTYYNNKQPRNKRTHQ
jgi:hypothetical protein